MRANVTLIYIDSGGGHRAAARALSDVIQEQRRPWNLQSVSLQSLLAPIDYIRKSTGVPFEEVYNILLRRGWTFGTQQLIPVMHRLIRASHDSQVRVLERYWETQRPHLVVSLIPNFNRALRQSLSRVWPETPYVTVLTDIADYPPNFWIESMDQWVVCGSDRAAEQAHQTGVPQQRILRASGMIVHPRFYSLAKVDRAREFANRGLDPKKPLALMFFGGEGSTEMRGITKKLRRSHPELQIIAVCGHNRALEAEMRKLSQGSPIFVEGFTREIPVLMEISDVMIGKPGPGCLSEAMVKGLPVVVQRNRWTLAQELYNTEWIEKIGAGIVVESFSRDVCRAVERILAPGQHEQYRARAAATKNFAVFEIPEMLNRILSETGANRPAPACDSGGRFLRESAHSA